MSPSSIFFKVLITKWNIKVNREIFLTEAKPVLISPRSPRKGSDCNPVERSVLAIACWEPCKVNNPISIANFRELPNDVSEIKLRIALCCHSLFAPLFWGNLYEILHSFESLIGTNSSRVLFSPPVGHNPCIHMQCFNL